MTQDCLVESTVAWVNPVRKRRWRRRRRSGRHTADVVRYILYTVS